LSRNSSRSSGASLLAVALWCTVAAGARAAEQDTNVLRPDIYVEQGWDSNIFNRTEVALFLPASVIFHCPAGTTLDPHNKVRCVSDGQKDSLVTYVRPSLYFENRDELGHLRLGLGATGRKIWSESKLDGVDENATFDLERQVSPRLTLFGDASFQHLDDYKEIRSPNETQTNLFGQPQSFPGELFGAAQPSVNQDNGSGGLKYVLTPRTSLQLSASGGRSNFESLPLVDAQNFRDRTVIDAAAVLTHELDSLDELSLTVSHDGSEYQDIGFGTTNSDIQTAEVGWTRAWTPLWTTSLSIGGRMLETQQLDSPSFASVFDFGTLRGVSVRVGKSTTSDTGLGIVGSFSISRQFEDGYLKLAYDRSTRSTAGSGRTEFDTDTFTLDFSKQLLARLNFHTHAEYALYTSTSNNLSPYAATLHGIGSPSDPITSSCTFGGVDRLQILFVPTAAIGHQCIGGSQAETRRFTTVVSGLNWQMRRNLSSFVVVRYFHPLTREKFGQGPAFTGEDYDKVTVGIGFHYTWDVGL
jgi:hypothetical protein